MKQRCLCLCYPGASQKRKKALKLEGVRKKKKETYKNKILNNDKRTMQMRAPQNDFTEMQRVYERDSVKWK